MPLDGSLHHLVNQSFHSRLALSLSERLVFFNALVCCVSAVGLRLGCFDCGHCHNRPI